MFSLNSIQALYYVFTNHAFGEQWTRYSWIQLAGMIILFIGTAVYNGTLRVHGWDYEEIDLEEREQQQSFSALSSQDRRTPVLPLSSQMFASNDITNSPIIRRNIRKDWFQMNGAQGEADPAELQQQQQILLSHIDSKQRPNGSPINYGSMYSNEAAPQQPTEVAQASKQQKQQQR